MENNMTMVRVEMDGKTIEVSVRENIPYKQQAACVKTAADMIVDKQGNFLPWAHDIQLVLIVLTQYTDFQIPDGWGDNELMEFANHSEGYHQIVAAIDTEELFCIERWIEELIEYRKQFMIHNGLERLLKNVADIVNPFIDMAETNPDAFEAMLGMVLGKLETLTEKQG